MLVGIPGSGKSTLSEEYRRRGYRVHASDAIREELYCSEETQGKPSEVFDVLLRRTRDDLQAGFSCVMDATNIRRKYRISSLQALSRFAATRRCVMALASPRECFRRNDLRARKVPPEALYRMLCAFEAPWYGEGWDAVEAVYSGEPYAFPRDEVKGFSQDNPHHSLTLGAHLDATRDYCMEHGFPAAVQEAAWYHDIGKLYTKRFENRRGEPTEIAHFYGHENYGAYLYLCQRAPAATRDGGWEDALYIANLINWHMRPLNNWHDSPVREARDRRLMGERMCADVKQLHEADLAAH